MLQAPVTGPDCSNIARDIYKFITHYLSKVGIQVGNGTHHYQGQADAANDLNHVQDHPDHDERSFLGLDSVK